MRATLMYMKWEARLILQSAGPCLAVLFVLTIMQWGHAWGFTSNETWQSVIRGTANLSYIYLTFFFLIAFLTKKSRRQYRLLEAFNPQGEWWRLVVTTLLLVITTMLAAWFYGIIMGLGIDEPHVKGLIRVEGQQTTSYLGFQFVVTMVLTPLIMLNFRIKLFNKERGRFSSLMTTVVLSIVGFIIVVASAGFLTFSYFPLSSLILGLAGFLLFAAPNLMLNSNSDAVL